MNTVIFNYVELSFFCHSIITLQGNIESKIKAPALKCRLKDTNERINTLCVYKNE